MKCKTCGSDTATKHGSYRNKQGSHQRYKCQSCGSTWYIKNESKEALREK